MQILRKVEWFDPDRPANGTVFVKDDEEDKTVGTARVVFMDGTEQKIREVITVDPDDFLIVITQEDNAQTILVTENVKFVHIEQEPYVD